MRRLLGGARLERVKASAQWKDSAFHNVTGAGPGLKGSPLPLIGEYFFSDAQRTPKGRLPLEDPKLHWPKRPDGGFRITWLGHSSVLLEIDGRTVLTDPVFGERASPLSFAGPRRFHEVPARVEELPPIDVVVLSHNHYDHLCAPTMRSLAKLGVPIVTALGVGAYLEALGVPAEKITELDWGESTEAFGVRLTATPAQHFSGRGVSDRNKSLWAAWVIESERHKVFFSGDTGLTTAFEETGRRYGPFDLVMLEIGAFNDAWSDIHLGPINALKVFDMLGGGTLFPVHWGTFNLALHAWDEPAETLLANTGGRRVITPRLGLPIEPRRLEGPTPWWRAIEPLPAGCSFFATER
ncbi:MAG: MBL fold metallo-hydrolase [Myxococcota bacterium]